MSSRAIPPVVTCLLLAAAWAGCDPGGSAASGPDASVDPEDHKAPPRMVVFGSPPAEPVPDAGARDRAAASDRPADSGDAVAPGPPGGGTSTCAAGAPLCLRWPLEGREGVDWLVVNYVDTDPGSGVADYTGARGATARTYDGHNGVDIGIASFRKMDEGVVVHAATDGTVVATAQQFADRNTSWPSNCATTANHVDVRHDSGHLVRYFHLRRNSVMVAIGQRVVSGTPLGLVGSSGCSTGPHLHLEVRDTADHVVDPYARNLLEHATAYDAAMALMATNTVAGRIQGSEDMTDPPADARFIAAGGALGVGLVVSSPHAGDRISFRYDRPDGSTFYQADVQFTERYTMGLPYANATLGTETGTWRVAILLNAVEITQLSIPVR